MEEITKQTIREIEKEEIQELDKIVDEGGKITDTVIREKDKIITTRKVESVNGEVTNFTIIQNKESIIINP